MRTKNTSLLAWLKTASDDQVAKTGTTRGYLRLIAYGHKTASPEIAAGVERATGAVVTRQDLRPHDWQQIWPELSAA